MIGRSNRIGSSVRLSVSENIVWGAVSAKNCLGHSARDIGHSRVPDPPDRITGVIFALLAIASVLYRLLCD